MCQSCTMIQREQRWQWPDFTCRQCAAVVKTQSVKILGGEVGEILVHDTDLKSSLLSLIVLKMDPRQIALK